MSIGTNKDLEAFVRFASGGRHTAPSLEAVQQAIDHMVLEGQDCARRELAALRARGGKAHLCMDIWSALHVSLLAGIATYAGDDGVVKEIVVCCIPCGAQAHTGDFIQLQVEKALEELGCSPQDFATVQTLPRSKQVHGGEFPHG